jgi:hypothetical protein
MLELQTLLHGGAAIAGPLRADHLLMLNRKRGSAGRTWHSHAYGPGDTADVDITEGTGLKLVRTLCFPEGVDPARGGAVGVGLGLGRVVALSYCPSTLHLNR